MGSMKSMAAAACAALLLTSAAATAQTTQDRLTFVTFSGPVSIPGKTLPAGTYAFKLADSPADRHIVQVYDKDQMQLYATLLAIPADRTEAEGEPVITFKETASDRPPAVRYWYYAGERSGNEFVYPKSQALMIARASGESVMSVDTDSTSIDDWKTGKTSRVTGNAEPQSSTTASTTSTSTTTSTDTTTTASQPAQPTTASSATTSQPTTSQPTTAQPATTQPTTTAPDQTTRPAAAVTAQPTTPDTTAPTTAQPTTSQPSTAPVGTSGRSELPRTASELPAIGLIGVFALAGALVLRVARRAHA